ncbi:MAG: hypothetical protein HFH14_09920 [Lachnospiraceae bacterium]|nr:hypothetical protein [Lachnospiraceae bacterium]
MLSKKKIKIMFRMASYEQGRGKKDLNTVRFYKADYVRLNILKSIVCMTIAYALVLGLVVLYNAEYIIKNAVKLPYYSIGLKVLGIYISLVVFYIIVSLAVYASRYGHARKRVQRYFKYLKYLSKYYDNDGEGYEEEERDDF